LFQDDGKKKGAAVASTVLQAAAVHCYKLIGGQYENVGKVGAALLGAGQSSAEVCWNLYILYYFISYSGYDIIYQHV